MALCGEVARDVAKNLNKQNLMPLGSSHGLALFLDGSPVVSYGISDMCLGWHVKPIKVPRADDTEKDGKDTASGTKKSKKRAKPAAVQELPALKWEGARGTIHASIGQVTIQTSHPHGTHPALPSTQYPCSFHPPPPNPHPTSQISRHMHGFTGTQTCIGSGFQLELFWVLPLPRKCMCTNADVFQLATHNLPYASSCAFVVVCIFLHIPKEIATHTVEHTSWSTTVNFEDKAFIFTYQIPHLEFDTTNQNITDDDIKELPLRRALGPMDIDKMYFDEDSGGMPPAKKQKSAVSAFASR